MSYCGADTTKEPTRAFILEYDGNAVQHTLVQPGRHLLGLQFTLKLQAVHLPYQGFARCSVQRNAYRILTVSKGWVTVTAPQAAIPPAMKALTISLDCKEAGAEGVRMTCPVVVDIMLGSVFSQDRAGALPHYIGSIGFGQRSMDCISIRIVAAILLHLSLSARVWNMVGGCIRKVSNGLLESQNR